MLNTFCSNCRHPTFKQIQLSLMNSQLINRNTIMNAILQNLTICIWYQTYSPILDIRGMLSILSHHLKTQHHFLIQHLQIDSTMNA